MIKNNSDIEIRGAKSKREFMDTVKNAARSFGCHEKAFINSNIEFPGFKLENARLLISKGLIVSSINIQKRIIDVNSGTLQAGCVADVNTLPEYRNKGYGSLLLEDALNYMKKRGDDISLLFTSKYGYYGRYGWVSVPRARYYLESEKAGILVPERYRTKMVNARTATGLLKSLYKNPSADYCGGVKRNDVYWKKLPEFHDSRNSVYITAYEGSAVVAIAVLVIHKDCVRIYECVNLTGHDEAPKNLLNEALIVAKDEGIEYLHATLPETHPMAVKIMLLGGVKDVDNELMLKVINPEKVTTLIKSKNILQKTELLENIIMRELMGYSGFNDKTYQKHEYRSSLDLGYWDSDKF